MGGVKKAALQNEGEPSQSCGKASRNVCLYSCILFCCIGFEKGFLCIPSYPATHYADQVGLCLLSVRIKGMSHKSS